MERYMRSAGRLALAVGLLASWGCEEDAEPVSDGGQEPSAEVGEVSSDISSEIETEVDYDAVVFRYSDAELPYETAEQCKAFAADEDGDDSESTRCRCDACLEVMQECHALQGCREIVAFSNESSCSGAFACYLLPGAPCTEVIDRWGNASLAAAISLELMDCSDNAGC